MIRVHPRSSAAIILFLTPALAELSPTQRRLALESVDFAWTTIRQNHWDQQKVGPAWDKAHQDARAAVATAAGMDQVRAAMNRMLATLGESHFGVVPGEMYEHLEAGAEPGVTGVEPGLVDGRAIVLSVDPDSPAARAGVHAGWWIESVRGKPVAPLLAKAHGELFKVRLLRKLLSAALGAQVAVEFIDGAGQSVALSLAVATPRGAVARYGNLPEMRVWIDSRRLPGPVAYIRFNLFFDPETLVAQFARVVRDCAACRGFIVDLRDNPGGIGALAMGIAGFFVDGVSQELGVMRGQLNLKFTINPRPERFSGPLAILVDGSSASTSEIFAAGLQDLGRARIFGAPTAGAALPSVLVKMPDGDGLQYAIAEYITHSGKLLEGTGVTPDEKILPTRGALLSGHDLALEAAQKWIASRR